MPQAKDALLQYNGYSKAFQLVEYLFLIFSFRGFNQKILTKVLHKIDAFFR